MTTAYGDPNSTVSYTWSDADGSDHLRVNDGVRQPSAPSTGGDGQYCYCSPNDDNELASFGCSEPSISGTVTAVTAWAYMEWQNSGGTMNLGAYFNGTTQTASAKSVLNYQQWFSTAYTSLSIAAASLFPWRINLQPGTVGKTDDVFVYGVYLEVTYTAGGGGSSGQPMMRRWGGIPRMFPGRGKTRGRTWCVRPSGLIIPRPIRIVHKRGIVR